jgi:hypothetical protein
MIISRKKKEKKMKVQIIFLQKNKKIKGKIEK